jgi:hypothetical protein
MPKNKSCVASVYSKLQVKVNLPLCFFLTEHHAKKAYWWSGSTAPLSL